MHFGPSPLLSAFLPALLSNQVPLNPVQTEEKPLPPPVVQHDTEAEKQLIREVRPRAGGEGEAGGACPTDRLKKDVVSTTASPRGWYYNLPLGTQKG